MAAAVVGITLAATVGTGGASGAGAKSASDEPIYRPGTAPMRMNEEAERALLERDFALESRQTAGTARIGLGRLGRLQDSALRSARRARVRRPALHVRSGAPTPVGSFAGAWSAIGPSPISEVTRASQTLQDMNGRIGALVIRRDGTVVLGGAHGGVWVLGPNDTTWTPKTDQLGALPIGALAIAPSDDALIYAGTGEGSLAGDSAIGNGILRSTNGGATWSHVSGDYFRGVAISRLVVDPTDKRHLYAAVLRGRSGARRVSPPVHSRYGVWESRDGGRGWRLLRAAGQDNGVTDIEIDPRNPRLLVASIWGSGIIRSTNGGASWAPAMNGLPVADYSAGPTRFSIGLSHPAGDAKATLYAGFDVPGEPAHVYRSSDAGSSWAQLPDGTMPDSILDYCGEQCAYDNVIEADPNDANVVYAGGMFNYNNGTGGIYRSDDGGQTWKDLGFDQHPDFHALAFDPNDSHQVLVGSDGGVWFSADRGGRPNASDPLDAVTWQSLNAAGLQIAQFTSIQSNPAWTDESGNAFPSRVWGGTQDNGTLRHRTASTATGMTDVSSGDGGQVLVDPTDSNFVFGTYYGVSPYRFDNGGAFLFSNASITRGIDTSDRSDFYIPWVLNHDDPNQLFLGTYRVYRTDNAKAASAGDVAWAPISGDLTSGCTGSAPNGARNCTLSAFGVGGGTGVYAGSLDGYLWVSPDAQSAQAPAWTRIGERSLPARPVQSIAVDRSNDRIAYVAYGGFDAGTPGREGHVFATSDGGRSFADVSGNLPDSPVNTVVLDASSASTLYVGTDVGPYVTRNGGSTWSFMGGPSHPLVAVWQMDIDPAHGTLLSGTHGRGAFGMVDTTPRVALAVDTVDAGIPVGPGSDLDYTITVRNIGTGDASGVTVTDRAPTGTSIASVASGGTASGGTVTWKDLAIPAGGSVSLAFRTRISPTLSASVTSLVNSRLTVTSAQGPSTTGSAVVTPIAAPYALSVAPATQTDGGRVGTTVTYPATITNRGYKADSYTVATTGGTFAATVYASDCVTPLATTAQVAAGGSTGICVGVVIPAAAADGDSSSATLTVTSAGSATVTGTATTRTIAANASTLVVDGDGNGPDVQSAYTAALTAAGKTFGVWDLAADADLPTNYLLAYPNVVWFTGNTYPGPITRYEGALASYLDGGGHLFLSGQDVLDQAAGQTDFVLNYLHVAWDGTEAQNDKATAAVHGVAGSIADGVGDVPLDIGVLGAPYMDQVTPTAGANGIFTDDSAQTNGLSVDATTYKVVFLAFPFEEYGTAAQKADLMGRAMTFFGP
jgi:uncharacterized repeat protein (TIGR01451 family)